MRDLNSLFDQMYILKHASRDLGSHLTVKNQLMPPILFNSFFILWSCFVVGFRSDHLTLLLLVNGLYFTHIVTRKLLFSFVFFLFFWIIYDTMRVYPNYMVNDVSTLSLYNMERRLFGVNYQGTTVTLNEYFYMNKTKWLDFLSGFFYLTWVPVPMAVGLYLFFKNKKVLILFGACYLFVNLLGFSIYYLYPAAPPWYVHEYGDLIRYDIAGNAAGLLRFDQLINYPLFENMYNKNSNVFAAVPSLHAAYPVVTLFYVMKAKLRWIMPVLVIDVLGIWFSAVYSFHHYVIDIILGFLCALLGIIIFEKIVRISKIQKMINTFVRFVER